MAKQSERPKPLSPAPLQGIDIPKPAKQPIQGVEPQKLQPCPIGVDRPRKPKK